MYMPITKEQMEANRKFVDAELKKCSKIAKDNNLNYVCIVHWDPLADKLVSTVGYFEERFEAIVWAEGKEKLYNGSLIDIIYSIYVNGNLYK